ncbi:MAG: AAA family ATPase [Nitrospirales bacterium]|nr:AAA family ATPase [Nitrospirales bacterium]
MYLSFYGLKKEPFHTTPDPNFLYLSPTHKEALGAIIYGIEQRKGFISITGEVGVGKTTIIRAYLERPTTRTQKTIYIFNPVVSFHALLTTIFRSLEVEPRQSDLPEMVNQLHEILITEYRANSTVVLVIDEAQNMPVETLENLRMLSNLETVADKLIQIVLIGQPELNTLLDDPKLKALKQRIALRATICPLTPKECQAYIEHRVNLASHTGNPLFTKDAIKLLTQQAQGIPRRLNILCDNALITGYGRQRNPATVSEVREIIADLDAKGPTLISKWRFVAAAALLLAIASFFLVFSFFSSNFSPSDLSQNDMFKENRKTNGKYVDNGESLQRISGKSPGATGSQVEDASHEDRAKGAVMSQEEHQKMALNPRASSGAPSMVEKPLTKEPTEVSSNASKGSNDGSLIFADQMTEKTIAPRPNVQPNVQAPLLQDGEKSVGFDNHSDTITNEIPNQKTHKIFPRTRLVKKGESLSRITHEIYGSDDPEYLNWVRDHNSEITNPDFILPGQKIILPEYVKE